jgi:hypothetical protein
MMALVSNAIVEMGSLKTPLLPVYSTATTEQLLLLDTDVVLMMKRNATMTSELECVTYKYTT